MTIINEKIDFEKKIKNILKLYEIGSFEEVISRTKPLIKKYPDIVDLYNQVSQYLSVLQLLFYLHYYNQILNQLI